MSQKSEQKPPPLRSIYLYPTDECNLTCRHCWVNPPLRDPKDKERKELPFDSIKDVIEQALPLGLRSVKLTGGEPLLYSRFEELLIYLHQEKKLIVNLETNGTLVTPERARLIKEKVNNLAVSVDGAIAATHERMRVIKGSFEQALQGIRYLAAAGLPPQMIFCITAWNKHEFFEVAKLAKDLGCRDLKVNKPAHIARGQGLEKSGELLTLSEILECHRYSLEIEKELDLHIFFSVPLAFKSLDRVVRYSGCRCILHGLMGITGDGTISLCGIVRSVGNLNMGNIKDTRLEKVWKENPIFQKIRQDIPQNLEGICGKCIHRNACLGYCVALNYFDTQSLTAPLQFCQQAYEEGLFPESRLVPERNDGNRGKITASVNTATG